MSVQIQFVEMNDYLAVRFIGAGTAADVWRQFEPIAERCNRAKKNKLLLDFLEAYGELSFVDRYFIGAEAQIFSLYNIKVATIVRPEHLDPRRLVEIVAQNRGIKFRAFTNAEDAKEWLLKE
jgi:hypothetical protein